MYQLGDSKLEVRELLVKAFASAWESHADGTFTRHMEPLEFTAVPLATRSYS